MHQKYMDMLFSVWRFLDGVTLCRNGKYSSGTHQYTTGKVTLQGNVGNRLETLLLYRSTDL